MAEQLLKDANSAFVDEEYESALDLYTKSIEAEPSAEAHANRSHANFKLGHFQEAVGEPVCERGACEWMRSWRARAQCLHTASG